MKYNTLMIMVMVALIFGAGGFFGGMQFQKSQNPPRGQFSQARQRSNQNFRPVAGEILNMDEKSITVKLQDGSSKIVLFSDTTSISKSDKAEKGDLKVGEKVAVFGTDNSDGSVTAQNIQLNPINRTSGKM